MSLKINNSRKIEKHYRNRIILVFVAFLFWITDAVPKTDFNSQLQIFLSFNLFFIHYSVIFGRAIPRGAPGALALGAKIKGGKIEYFMTEKTCLNWFISSPLSFPT